MRVEYPTRKDRIINTLSILEGHPAILSLKYVLGDDIYVTRIRGPTLESYLKNDETWPLNFPTVLDFSLRMVDAVAWCHAHGIIHSDIADRNFMVNSQGKIYLIDFGNSRRYTTEVRDSVIPGATAFACPEHDLGIDIGFAADVFALGGVLYKLISGVGPFDHALQHNPSLSETENWIHNRVRVLDAKLHRNFKPLEEYNTAFYDGEMFEIIEGMLTNHQSEENSANNLLGWFKEKDRIEKIIQSPPLAVIQPTKDKKYIRDWSGSELYADEIRNGGNSLDLSHTDLTNTTLKGDFSGFIFNHSTLRDADLHEVNLRQAWMLDVDARDANFRGVQAQYSNFSLSDISGSEVGNMRLDCSVLHASTAKDLHIDKGERLYFFTDKHKGLYFSVHSPDMIDRLVGIDASPQIMSEVISNTMDISVTPIWTIMNALESGRLGCYNGLNRMLDHPAFSDYKEEFRRIFYRYASQERWDLEEELFYMKQTGWHQAEHWVEKWIDGCYAKIVFHHAVRTIHPHHPLDIKNLRKKADTALAKFQDAYPYFEPANRSSSDIQ